MQLAGLFDRRSCRSFGGDSYNLGLSQRRARNVAAVLEQAGVASGTLAIDGMGERVMRVDTADGVREPQNRRVEISASASVQ